MNSKHYSEEREAREAIIKKIGQGEVVASFRVDRGHRNGAEIHKITNTGIILIYNERTGKMITKLIARVGQIRRYYKDGNAPRYLIEKALDNTVKNNYNEY